MGFRGWLLTPSRAEPTLLLWVGTQERDNQREQQTRTIALFSKACIHKTPKQQQVPTCRVQGGGKSSREMGGGKCLSPRMGA